MEALKHDNYPKTPRPVQLWRDQSGPETIELFGFLLRKTLERTAKRIEGSRRLLELEDNWDDEGSPGYLLPTWEAAVKIVVDTANIYWHTNQQEGPSPAVSAGPDGSIDMTYRVGSRQVLVNVPPVDAGSATYSGIDLEEENRVTKGRIPPGDNLAWLMMWLTA